MALFIAMEVALHWLWCLFVFVFQNALDSYVNVHLLYPLWLVVTLVGLFFWWMINHLSKIKNNDKDLLKWQLVLIIPYTAYLAIVIVMMGYSSLFAGVSLAGGTMLGMMLIKRRYVWRVSLVQIVLILLAVIAPYFGINLPNLRELAITLPILDAYNYMNYNEIMGIENAVVAVIFKNETLGWNHISEIQRSSAFFWRATHIYIWHYLKLYL